MFDRLSRYAPLTGIAFAVMTLIAITQSKTSPNGSAGGTQVLAFYTAHKSAQESGDVLFAIAFVLFLFFAGSVYGVLRRSEAAHTLATVGLVGASILVVGTAVLGGIDYALAYASHNLGPNAATALNVIDNEVFLPVSMGAVVFGIATGLAILRSGLLPAWLGWVVLVAGCATGVPSRNASGIALFALLIWSIITSVLIFRRSAPAAVPSLVEA
jgi:uncharacterized membrane-anchored protein YitT (DUF2179 family)